PLFALEQALLVRGIEAAPQELHGSQLPEFRGVALAEEYGRHAALAQQTRQPESAHDLTDQSFAGGHCDFQSTHALRRRHVQWSALDRCRQQQRQRGAIVDIVQVLRNPLGTLAGWQFQGDVENLAQALAAFRGQQRCSVDGLRVHATKNAASVRSGPSRGPGVIPAQRNRALRNARAKTQSRWTVLRVRSSASATCSVVSPAK